VKIRRDYWIWPRIGGCQLFRQYYRCAPQTRQRRPGGLGCPLRDGQHRAPYGQDGIGRHHELVGIGELGMPNPATAAAANLAGPASGQPQACHFNAIGGSAVWTDEQHWHIGKHEGNARGP